MTPTSDNPPCPNGCGELTLYGTRLVCIECGATSGFVYDSSYDVPIPAEMLAWYRNLGSVPTAFWEEIGDMCDSCEKAVQACQCGKGEPITPLDTTLVKSEIIPGED